MRSAIGIEGREYKLLLDQSHFIGAPSDKTAKTFWNRELKPIIEKRLNGKTLGGSRAEGELSLEKQRVVIFLDTKQGLLSDCGFALRKRTYVENGELSGKPEVTLKFRTPDLLLAADYCRAAKKGDGETKLEEDIAPLQVSRGKKPVAVANPLSTYSRFSVSTKLDLDGALETLGDVFERFGSLRDSIGRDRRGKADEKLRLVPGPTICEWVFQNAAVDLGENLDAEFGFTLWYLLEGGTKKIPWKRAASGALDPRIAEISFDFETKDGRMDAEAAERATKLFIAMQEKLPVNTRETSKTALGLPAGA